jgi:hypothetical protein
MSGTFLTSVRIAFAVSTVCPGWPTRELAQTFFMTHVRLRVVASVERLGITNAETTYG